MALVGTADLVLRRATLRGVRPASFMVLQSWFFGSTALTWTLATDGFRWHPGVLLGPVAGVLAFVATDSFLWSLQTPGAPQMSLVFTFLLAAPLFREPVTPRKLAGLAAAILAVLALSVPGSGRER